MRSIEEIITEITRCEIERDKCIEGLILTDETNFRMFNNRLWALKWVLKTEEEK